MARGLHRIWIVKLEKLRDSWLCYITRTSVALPQTLATI